MDSPGIRNASVKQDFGFISGFRVVVASGLGAFVRGSMGFQTHVVELPPIAIQMDAAKTDV